jgi:hypothetical protein
LHIATAALIRADQEKLAVFHWLGSGTACVSAVSARDAGIISLPSARPAKNTAAPHTLKKLTTNVTSPMIVPTNIRTFKNICKIGSAIGERHTMRRRVDWTWG